MIIRAKFPDLVLTTMLPALDEVIFNKYNRHADMYRRIFKVRNSGRSIEQTSEVAGLGQFVELAENAAMHYDEAVPGFAKTYTHLQYGLGFRISRIMVDDDKFGVITKMSSDLGRSAADTREAICANIFNNGFSSSYPGPDGKALFATDHPLVKTGGTESNTPSVAADIDIAAIEVALTAFRKMKDPSGKRVRVVPVTLLVPPDLEFVGSEIMNATMRSDTANNTPNALMKRVGMPSFSKLAVWDYLTDPDAFFILAAPGDHELRFYWREKPSTVHAIDFDTRAVKTAMWYRHSVGWSSFYGVYGSPGA